MDGVRFQAAVARALLRKPGGIGMLGEKTLHSALKYYYEPDSSLHEREAWGFLADVKNEEGVIEIQTRGLYSLGRKLEVYLKNTRVTVVHPVIRERRLVYVDKDTGELKPPRRSPRKGCIYDACRELIHIRKYLGDPNLMVIAPVVDADEYRIKTGEKRRRRDPGVQKFELVPGELIEEWVFVCPEDWQRLIPESLLKAPEGFTAAELARALKKSEYDARLVCGVLLAANALCRERRGRAYRYFPAGYEFNNEKEHE